MKHLMRYEGFSIQDRLDEILDKIKDKGIDSISKDERDFLDAYAKGNKEVEEIHKKLNYLENDITFEYDGPYPFKFVMKDVEHYGDETYINGTITVPDIILDHMEIEGEIDGRIVYFNTGAVVPDFTKEHDGISYDIFEFCEGLEYELDAFLDYIVGEVEKMDF